MHTDNLIINDSRAWKAIERVAKGLPELDTEPTATFVIKAINAINSGAFVISTQYKKVFGVLDLIGEQERDHLKGLLATINIIAQEEVVGFGGEPAVLEETEQIVELTVDVTADLDGGSEFEEHGLGEDEFSRLVA